MEKPHKLPDLKNTQSQNDSTDPSQKPLESHELMKQITAVNHQENQAPFTIHMTARLEAGGPKKTPKQKQYDAWLLEQAKVLEALEKEKKKRDKLQEDLDKVKRDLGNNKQ
jgi:hypothetical protein